MKNNIVVRLKGFVPAEASVGGAFRTHLTSRNATEFMSSHDIRSVLNAGRIIGWLFHQVDIARNAAAASAVATIGMFVAKIYPGRPLEGRLVEKADQINSNAREQIYFTL